MTMAELRSRVILRDGRCVISIVAADHVCANRWGEEHRPDDLDSLTLGHVRAHPGSRRQDDEGWLIAQCWRSNYRHEESANAFAVRVYLTGVRAGLKEACHH